MDDRGKVIIGLESLRDICNAKSDMAIGEGKVAWAGYANTADDALALLKAQEVPDTNAGKWTTERTQEHDGEWYCSECGYVPVVMTDDMKYCPGCGRKMIMPEPPKEG